MGKKVDHSMIMKALEWGYEKAMDSAYDIAEEYSNKEGTLEENVDSFIRWQMSKTAISGGLTGLGGLATIPLVVPEVGYVLYTQIRMIMTIAIMGGHNPKNDKVKTLILGCLLGKAAEEFFLQEMSVKLGVKLTQKMIEKIPGKVLIRINQMVGFRLVTKFGSKGVVNLMRIVPIIPSVIFAFINAVGTRSIGKVAKKTFC